MKKKFLGLILTAVMVMNTVVLTACNQEVSNTDSISWENSGSDSSDDSGQEVEQKLEERIRDDSPEHRELLSDLNFSRGFAVTPFHSNSSGGAKVGYLDYDGMKADGNAIWTLAQWGCTNNIFEDSEYSREGAVLRYADAGKNLVVDSSETGKITLGIKGSKEYPLDEEGRIPERTDAAANWPHILIEQTVNQEIGDVDNVYMEIEYQVTDCKRLVDEAYGEPDPALNAAQFQWFITLQDSDEESESYGSTMWFGFSMFDTRSMNEFPAGTASYDGGKEDSTGLFIYMFSLSQAANLSGCEVSGMSSVIGETVRIKVDIKKFLRTALKIAAQQGAMKGASVERLKIGSTNIGWELPGNYDVEVDIHSMNMYTVKK